MSGLVLLAALLAAFGGCAVGPNYKRPAMNIPLQYKENKDWKQAQPRDDLPKGSWWEGFGDPQLNALEAQVTIYNQNVKLAEAQFRQARALTRAAGAAFFPTLGATASATRGGGGSGGARSTTTTGTVFAPSISTNYNLGADIAWDLDIWGRVRRSVEANEASFQASAADLESIRLSSQAELAQDYFLLRVQDTQIELLTRSTEAYQKSLQLSTNQYNVGVVAKTDVVQAQTQLETTRAQAIDAGVQRAQLEHAIALLIGKVPSELTIPAAPLNLRAPSVPVDLASSLLERRPDIAAAERKMAAANAQIGVTIAAYFPTLSLSATGGFASSSLAHWLTLPNRYWSIGPALAETLFDGGLRQYQTQAARAVYDQAVASYRETVLTAFQQVEDNLAALRILEQETAIQENAVRLARQALDLVTNQYKAGTVSYVNVVVAQTTALNNERNAIDILGRQFTANVLLIKALGGGWEVGLLDSNKLAQSMPNTP